MKLTFALTAAIIAATGTQALPFQPNEGVPSEVLARTSLNTHKATLQLNQQGTNVTAGHQDESIIMGRDNDGKPQAVQPGGLAKRSGRLELEAESLSDFLGRLVKFNKALTDEDLEIARVESFATYDPKAQTPQEARAAVINWLSSNRVDPKHIEKLKKMEKGSSSRADS